MNNNMSELKVCRICMRSEVKMYHYSLYSLKLYYEEVMAVRVRMYDGLPQYFCYECATVLHKFHKFKEKCHNGQRFLKEMLEKGPISYRSISELDLKDSMLKSPLTKINIMEQNNEFFFSQDKDIEHQGDLEAKIENIEPDYFSDPIKEDNEPTTELNKEELDVTLEDNIKIDDESDVFDEHLKFQGATTYVSDDSEQFYDETIDVSDENIISDDDDNDEDDDDVSVKKRKSDDDYSPPQSDDGGNKSDESYNPPKCLQPKTGKKRPIPLPPKPYDRRKKKRKRHYGLGLNNKSNTARKDAKCTYCGLDIHDRNSLNTHRLCFKKSIEAFIKDDGLNLKQSDGNKSAGGNGQDTVQTDNGMENNGPDSNNTPIEDEDSQANTYTSKVANCISCGLDINNQNSLEHSTCFKTTIEAFIKRIEDAQRLVCQICGVALKPSSMTTHLLIHSSVKPYECDTCGKKFKTKTHLKTHIMTHTGERPFKCPDCNKRFSQESNMKIHHRTVHLKQPYHKKYYKRKTFPWEESQIEEKKKSKLRE